MSVSELFTIRRDLIRKNLVPKYSQYLMFDPQVLRTQLKAHIQTGITSYVCPRCQIEIKAPKQWMIEHIKTHKATQEIRENEIRWHKVRAY